jgi:nicotinate-nucleotide pyrophosphorylase (carboxylating)
MTTELNNSIVLRLIEEAIHEDIGLGDLTTEAIVPADVLGRADLLVKQDGVIAGLEVAALIVRFVDPEATLNLIMADGSAVTKGTIVGTINGPLASILSAERTALNFLQRMSGIATLTSKFVDAVRGTNASITDTRKTAPGLRITDKLAVKLGGGINHRFGLDDMVLIKDNHIAAAGSVRTAIERCLAYLEPMKSPPRVEVEAQSMDDVRAILEYSKVHRIMLDNFSIERLRDAVRLINRAKEVEASGNVSLATVRSIAETGVDYISVGALTHSAPALDISLEVGPTPPPNR